MSIPFCSLNELRASNVMSRQAFLAASFLSYLLTFLAFSLFLIFLAHLTNNKVFPLRRSLTATIKETRSLSIGYACLNAAFN